ncbi:Flp family type IVb pilin [Cupriavidus basilensis]
MQTITRTMKQFVHDEDGVTAIEYGLIASLIAVVIIVSVTTIGTNLNNVFSYIGSKLTTPAAS